MGNAIHHTVGNLDSHSAGVLDNALPTPSTTRRDAAHHPLSVPHLARDFAGDFESFSATLVRDLAPRSTLEQVLVDRLVLAAWRLQLASFDDTCRALDGEPLPPLTRDDLRAERSLETALDILETARSVSRRWGHAAPDSRRVAATVEDAGDETDLDEGPFSNEWPVLPDAERAPADDETPAHDDDDDAIPSRWQDRLVFDLDVSDSSPVVKGTWVTVRHIVSMIVDGWLWSDILRTHPELVEDDIRTCLAYTVEQDNSGEY